MSQSDERTTNLAVLLDRHRAEIASSWAAAAQQFPVSHYREQPFEDLRAFMLRGVDAISESLASDSKTALDDYLTQVSQVRLRQGFDISEVIEGLLLLRHKALSLIQQALPSGSPQAYEAILQLDTVAEYMLVHFGHIYAEAMRASVKAQQKRTALMLDVAQAASSSLDLDQVLRRVAEGMLSAVRVPNCGIYLVDANRSVLIPHVAAGNPPKEIEEAFHNRPLDPAQDLLVRELLERQEPVVCNDAQVDRRVSRETAQVFGIRSVLAIPIKIGDRVLGAAMLNTREDYHAFTDEEIELAMGVANAVALAVENARLYAQAEQAAVMEERQRIAHELHDSVAQSIYSIILYSDTLKAFLDAGNADAAGVHLAQLHETAREALADMRSLVFELRPPILEKEGLVAALQARLDIVETHAGLKTDLRVEGEQVLSLDVAEEVYHSAQEALNNVIKHANANRVNVHLKFNEGMVSLEVCDDGIGFVPSDVEAKGGLGLRGMKERAERIGGMLTVESAPGEGTQVRLVALARRRNHVT